MDVPTTDDFSLTVLHFGSCCHKQGQFHGRQVRSVHRCKLARKLKHMEPHALFEKLRHEHVEKVMKYGNFSLTPSIGK